MAVARFSSLLVVLSLFASVVVADEAARPALSPELQKLLEQLDADDFDDRASASEQLAKLGKEALPALEEGVHSSSPEVATRSFDLLQQLFEKGNAESNIAAKASLDKLARGNDRVAEQAKKMLEPKVPPNDPNQPFPGGVRILGGGRAIRIVAPAMIARAAVPAGPIEEVGVRRAMSISTSIGPDGVKTINVDEDGQKIKIVENPKTGIEGEYTQTKDGKETVVKFAAKDADELKKKDPEAFKLYERFAKGGPVRAEVAFAAAAARVAGAAATREHFAELLKKLEEQIDSTTKELTESKANKDGRERVLTMRLESYARIREAYQRQMKELEAKEKDAPEKPVEPKEPQIEVKDLKIEIEVKGE
jgi:hypothetical protein